MVILFLFLFLPAFARLNDLLPETYMSGRELCERSQAIKEDRGFFITVPLNYDDPNQGITQIYGFFPFKKFDRSKPSVIYFTGGPGLSAHYHSVKDHPGRLFARLGYNVLLFDPRGTGCSRPETLKQYQMNEYYNSLFTARDAEIFRQYLGIKKWSVVGRSYGAVPAMMYASIFKEQSISLTLLAALMDNNKKYGAIEHVEDWILRNPLVKKSLEAAAYLPGYDAYQLGGFKLNIIQRYNDQIKRHGLIGLDQFTKEIIRDIDYSIDSPQNRKRSTHLEDLFTNQDDFIFQMMVHKEDLVRGVSDEHKDYYRISNYPVDIPITFFQGHRDPRTPASRVLKFYREHTQTQVYLFDQAGHMVVNPSIDGQRNRFTAPPAILDSALRGEIAQETCQNLLYNGTRRWLFARP